MLTPVGAGDIVVVVGVGARATALTAAAKAGPTGQVLQIDIGNDTFNTELGERALEETVETRRGTSDHLPVEDASADWVISQCAINDSADPPRALAEIVRVLKPGGRASVTDAVAEGHLDGSTNAGAAASCIGGSVGEAAFAEALLAVGLVDVAVTDRYAFDRSELIEVVATERMSTRETEHAAEALVGRVWSCRFLARKPYETPASPDDESKKGTP